MDISVGVRGKTGNSSSSKKTNVIIIGNGPSAITLSFFLSGYRPYWNGMQHPNEHLQAKLKASHGQSIVEQDLYHLCEGLEGRSHNPVALLLDTLTHPDADLGAIIPSVLDWRYEEEHSIDHIVLGKAPPGGAWQQMDGEMQTLSLANWMELPSVPFRKWLFKHRPSGFSNERATITDIKSYYMDYVRKHGLASHFHSHRTVTSVRKVYHMRNHIDSESGEVEPCCKNVKANHPFTWEVRGYHLLPETDGEKINESHREEFCYEAQHVVIATGTFDIANRLDVLGEDNPYVLHTLSEFEKAIMDGRITSSSDPVTIIGAGLTAADAIITAMQHHIPVQHIFRKKRNDPNLIFRKLPAPLYPEYHKVHNMMRGKEELSDMYTCYSQHSIIEFTDDRRVIIENEQGREQDVLHSSCAVVLIGCRPDLSFLLKDGRNLGIVPKRGIDSRYNPMDINSYTYETLHEPGLFAIGPLVGDNFVRFIRGGGLGIANYFSTRHKELKNYS